LIRADIQLSRFRRGLYQGAPDLSRPAGRVLALAVLLAMALVTLRGAIGAAQTPPVALRRILSGFASPVFVTRAPDGTDRLFVVEKEGTIRVAGGGEVRPTPFLDLSSIVESDGVEQGLFSIAFHPTYGAPDSRFGKHFFVAYTASDGANTVARFRVSDDPNVADPASRVELLAIPDKYPNHNGGMLAFGPDGYLYVGTGDGGGGGDPEENGEDRSELLAKMLRLDVDREADGKRYEPRHGLRDGEPGAPLPGAVRHDRDVPRLAADLGAGRLGRFRPRRPRRAGGHERGSDRGRPGQRLGLDEGPQRRGAGDRGLTPRRTGCYAAEVGGR
jgi:hypothetical protein